MRTTVTVTVAPDEDGGTERLLAPIGLPTPHQTSVGFAVTGGAFRLTGDTASGQIAALITPESGQPVTLTYTYAETGPGYPAELFTPRLNRYTRPAAALAEQARRTAGSAPRCGDAIGAVVNQVAETFVYSHPEVRFNDGLDEVPHVACGTAEGSCVDINTYLIACLRAAGFDAGYVTGYFFPAEKGGTCEDMHCWVVTRYAGAIQEWDIAHHLKLGTTEVRPGLNPKPGTRVAVGHSMGLEFPELGIRDLKLLAEPVRVDGNGRVRKTTVTIRMTTDGDRSTASAA